MAELTSLSASRANDFVLCPLKYRFRTVDRLPEPPSPAAFKGTLVHAVLEALFDAAPEDRVWRTAVDLIPGAYDALVGKDEDVAAMFPDDEARRGLWNEAAALLRTYFGLEDPSALEPAAREKHVRTGLDNGLELRGFIDRVDVADGGEVRLVDYKTGKQPRPQYSREADFQMRFYALLHYRTTGRLAHTLTLMYFGSESIKAVRPTAEDVERTEAEVLDIWEDIATSAESGRWRPQKTPLCGWCHFKDICPAWGGTPPPPPEITAIAGRPSAQAN